jgi:putative copper export protein
MLFVKIVVIWLHVLGVACWIGSLLGVTLFQLREIRESRFGRGGPDEALEHLWQRTRLIGWHSVTLIVITGILNIVNVVLTRAGSFPTPMMHIIGAKIVLLAIVVVVQLGPVRQANRATVNDGKRGKGLLWSIISLVLAFLAVLMGIGLRAY